MRILFISGALHGHVTPLLSTALAARQSGHDVAFACGPDFAAAIERRGLTAWRVGTSHADAGGNRQDAWLAYFERTAERRATDLLPRAVAWKPDLVIHEETELTGPAVAALTGARHAVHGLGRMPPARIWPKFMEALARLGQRWGTPAANALLARAPYLHLCPPSLESDQPPVWPRVLPMRPVSLPPLPGERLPPGLEALPLARTVYLTLGTVYNGNVDVLRHAIAALSTLDANLIVTVGPDGQPGRFGPQPAHVRIEAYVPQALLLPHCSLVVSQGGSGTLLGGFSHGLPQLVLPQGADQFFNADAAQASGAALSLSPADATPAAIAATARRLLDEPAFETAARRVQSEIKSMPEAAEVLQALVALPADAW